MYLDRMFNMMLDIYIIDMILICCLSLELNTEAEVEIYE